MRNGTMHITGLLLLLLIIYIIIIILVIDVKRFKNEILKFNM